MDPVDAQNEARDILSRTEFREPEPSLVGRGLEWIWERFTRLFDGLIGGFFDGTSSGIAWVLLVVAVLAIFYVAIGAGRKRTLRGRTRVEPLAAAVTFRRDSAAWLRIAEECEASGAFGDAVRAYYRSGTARLAETGRVGDNPGLTAGQLQRDFAAPGGDEKRALAHMTAAFESVWYGGDSADIELMKQVADDAMRIRQR